MDIIKPRITKHFKGICRELQKYRDEMDYPPTHPLNSNMEKVAFEIVRNGSLLVDELGEVAGFSTPSPWTIVYVSPDYRNQGWGSELLESIGCPPSNISSENIYSQLMVKSLGYEIVKEFENGRQLWVKK